MANLGQKDGIYLIRFRYLTKEFKRSLKTRSKADAEAAKRSVEQTIHRLLTGFLQVPLGVSAADYILSGGTLTTPVEPVPLKIIPTTRGLIREYLDSQQNKIAPSYLASQKLHLGHLEKFLETLADAPCDQVTHRDLDRFLQKRLAERASNTAKLERITLIQLFKWAVLQGYLVNSPAALLPAIKGGSDRPPFRTLEEIQRMIHRGGLADNEELDLWECLYLAPHEISMLLGIVRANASEDFTYLLHAFPAYTGMRRGEVLRARWIDLDLMDGYITARSRKQSRIQQETHRRIDLHPELKLELEMWKDQRPKGQFIICDAKTLEPLGKDRANRGFWQCERRSKSAAHGRSPMFGRKVQRSCPIRGFVTQTWDGKSVTGPANREEHECTETCICGPKSVAWC